MEEPTSSVLPLSLPQAHRERHIRTVKRSAISFFMLKTSLFGIFTITIAQGYGDVKNLQTMCVYRYKIKAERADSGLLSMVVIMDTMKH
jgi:hypothetical protein